LCFFSFFLFTCFSCSFFCCFAFLFFVRFSCSFLWCFLFPVLWCISDAFLAGCSEIFLDCFLRFSLGDLGPVRTACHTFEATELVISELHIFTETRHPVRTCASSPITKTLTSTLDIYTMRISIQDA